MKLVLVILSFFYLNTTKAQNVQKSYNASGDDKGHAIINTLDGGFAIAGYTSSFGAGGQDFFILKVDFSGNILWQKTYGSTGDENGTSIDVKQMPDSSYVVVGATTSFGANSLDAFVIRLDKNGNIIWSRKYNTATDSEHFRGVKIAANNDILIAGTDNADNFGSADGLVMRIDINGNVLWKNVYGGGVNDHFHSIEELPGGNIIVSGSTKTYGPGNTAGYVLKLDSDGNILWDYSFGGTGTDAYNGSTLTNDNKIMCVGLSDSYGGGSQVLVTKLDTNGVVIWSKVYGGGNYERGASIKTIPNSSDLYVVANTESYGNGGKELLIFRIDANGSVIWSKTYGTSSSDEFDVWAHGTMVSTGLGGIAFTGWSDGLGSGNNDILLISSDGFGSSFCNDISLTSALVVIDRIDPSGGQISAGVFNSVSSNTGNAAFQENSVCLCPETPVFNPISQLCVNDTPPQLPLTSLNGISGTWLPDTISTNVPGTYYFEFTPDIVSCANSNIITVFINGDCISLSPGISAPNVITPNDDDKNDYFELNAMNITNIDLLIINRWGNVMFEGSGVNPKWNGKVGDKYASEGTYFYKYTATGVNNEELIGHGFFELIRE